MDIKALTSEMKKNGGKMFLDAKEQKDAD